MSSLQRKVVLGGMLPPQGLPPRPLPTGRGGQVRGGRTKSYSPVHWGRYWHQKTQVVTDRGDFTVYCRGEGSTLVLLLHGGGYSGLTWSVAGEELAQLVSCRLVAMDLRGHGESKTGVGGDFSLDSLSEDVVSVASSLLQTGGHNSLVLVGHSLGGAVAVAAAQSLGSGVAGLVVIDVVEGTALDSLSHMQTFLRSRPQQFKTPSLAIEWCVRSGQSRNVESARVSMPGQILDNCGRLASSLLTGEEAAAPAEVAAGAVIGPGQRMPPPADTISEEEEGEGETGQKEEKNGPDNSTPVPHAATTTSTTSASPASPSISGPLTWAVDLCKTEPYWTGWFEGLSSRFLSVSAAKLLLLAGVDRLDRDLTVAQMQGKFQLIVLPQVGHAIHEDSPDKVASVLGQFLMRNRLAESKNPAVGNTPIPSLPGVFP